MTQNPKISTPASKVDPGNNIRNYRNREISINQCLCKCMHAYSFKIFLYELFFLLNHLDTNPGIECCKHFNVDSGCFPNCKQNDIPVNNTEESSRDMSCEDFSVTINKCRNGKEKIRNSIFQTFNEIED